MRRRQAHRFERAAPWLVRKGIAPSESQAYRLIAESKIPGVFRIGKSIFIDTALCLHAFSQKALGQEDPSAREVRDSRGDP